MKTTDLAPAQRKAMSAIKRIVSESPGIGRQELFDLAFQAGGARETVDKTLRILTDEGLLVTRKIPSGKNRHLLTYYWRGMDCVGTAWDALRIRIRAQDAPKFEGQKFRSAFRQTVHWLQLAGQSKTPPQNQRAGFTMLTAFGRTQCLADWADEFGINRKTLSSRLARKDITVEEALTMGVNHKHARRREHHA